MLLRDVFYSPDMVGNALDLYHQHYVAGWPLTTKVHLYNHAIDAYHIGNSNSHALRAFVQIYEYLRKYWKVFRGKDVVSYWEAVEALENLRGVCSAWGNSSDLTLMSLDVSNSRTQLQGCFDAFAGIKRLSSGDYPWMAASKFLHFFNPRLFPMWDRAEVWDMALNSRFQHDYQAFCRRIGAKPGERSSIFNCTYTAMAAELMQNAHPELMVQFASWFRQNCVGCDDKHSVLEDINTYYATAFEIILLGATKMQ